MSGGGDYKQEHLIKMANQIAHSVPSQDDVSGQVSQHLRQFWTSEMRQTLQEIAAEKPDRLIEHVHTALRSL